MKNNINFIKPEDKKWKPIEFNLKDFIQNGVPDNFSFSLDFVSNFGMSIEELFSVILEERKKLNEEEKEKLRKIISLSDINVKKNILNVSNRKPNDFSRLLEIYRELGLLNTLAESKYTFNINFDDTPSKFELTNEEINKIVDELESELYDEEWK